MSIHVTIYRSGGTAPYILNLGTMWRWSTSRPAALPPRKKKAGMGAGNDLDAVEKMKSLAHAGNRTLIPESASL
jgi:hypothetical protein